MSYFIAALILLVPYGLESLVKIGFARPGVERSAAFYILTPVASALVYLSFAAILGHPYIALAGWLLIYPGFTFVSNVKNSVLGEPLVAPDLETTRHLFIYPEFYVDYVGRWRFFGVLAAFAGSVILSYFTETSFASYQTALPGPVAWILMLAGWVLFLWVALKLVATLLTDERVRRLGISFDACEDVSRFGLFPLLLLYGILLLARTDKRHLHRNGGLEAETGTLPDILVLQAESYFDVSRLYDLVEGGTTAEWTTLKALQDKGVAHGALDVPAWGASTMQSEFAFLSGIPNNVLGIDRINPYLRMASVPVPTLASRLRALGYRTVCIHPAKKEFFRRHKVIPMMGFDEFIGLEAFSEEDRRGPYVSDAALGSKIEEIIAEHHANSDAPLFLFAITIESHGPWQEGRLSNWLDETDLHSADPTGDQSFALYRHHMDNALALFARLGPEAKPSRPRTMTLYGDHQPALYDLFTAHGFHDRRVNYLLWHSETTLAPAGDLKVEELANALLKAAGFKPAD